MRHTRDYDLPRPACPNCGMSIAVQERGTGWYCYHCHTEFDKDEVVGHE